MSKVLRTVGKIAGVIATVAMFIPGAQPIALAASAVSATANLGAAITAKKPAARGATNSVLIQTEAPSPYIMGRTYFAGVLRYDKAWGGKVGKVHNPYRAMVLVHSVAGPVEALESVLLDYQTVSFTADAATGYYAGFLYRDTQLGARPEASALTSYFAGMPDWSSSSKLSGKAAILLSLKFDKEGKVFSGGVPPIGAVWQGVKVYDPRLDSTRAGGSGTHRANDETTWAYSDNPALHALTYAIGRTQSGKRLFGIGIPEDGIDFAAFSAWANVCDTNDWTLGGTIFEPGDKWDNLRNIMAAGGAEPVFSGAVLSVKYDAPRVSLATIGIDDLAEGTLRRGFMASWRERINTVIPKYRSEAHKWEYVAGNAIAVAGFVTEDGEEKPEEIQFNLVQDLDQAAQLAGYRIYNGRAATFDLTLKPGWRIYEPGDMLTVDIPEANLIEQDAVVLSRTVDPATLAVTMSFVTEDTAKHAASLAFTGTAPPTPVYDDPADRDEAASYNGDPTGYASQLIGTSYTTGGSIVASDAGSDVSIAVSAHSRVYADKSVSVNSVNLTALAYSTTYFIYYDDATRAGGAVTYATTTTTTDALNSPTNPNRHYVGFVTTPAALGANTNGFMPTAPGSWSF